MELNGLWAALALIGGLIGLTAVLGLLGGVAVYLLSRFMP